MLHTCPVWKSHPPGTEKTRAALKMASWSVVKAAASTPATVMTNERVSVATQRNSGVGRGVGATTGAADAPRTGAGVVGCEAVPNGGWHG